MMDFNTTSVPGNSTSVSPTSSPNVGLIVGLSVFFVFALLIIVAGFLAYRKFGQLRRVLSFGSRKRIQREKEEEVQGVAPKTVRESHEYERRPERTTPQAPIYENVARSAGYGTNAPDRLMGETRAPGGNPSSHGDRNMPTPHRKPRRVDPQPPRSDHVPEDDVYLQCDAIYSNDPACNPSAHHQEDDTYIIPDS